MISIEVALLILSLLLLISIYASKISDRVGVPALLLFLVIGMLAGSDGIGGLAFTDARLAQNIGVAAWPSSCSQAPGHRMEQHPPGDEEAIPLALVGVAFTAVVMGWQPISTDFTLLEGMLLGSIVSSTDAAAVFSILRSKGVHLKPKIRALLELESEAMTRWRSSSPSAWSAAHPAGCDLPSWFPCSSSRWGSGPYSALSLAGWRCISSITSA